MTASVRHLDQALAYLFEAQEAAQREGDEAFFVKLRAIKRYAAKAKLDREQRKKQGVGQS
jgi:hypothetical protein